MKLSISTNFPQVQAQLKQLREDIATRALASAVNKTAAQARTQMSREIRQEFAMPAAKVNQALVVRKASAKAGIYSMTAALESPSKRGRSLNLINFSAKQTRKGVTVRISRKGGRKLLASAFIANKGRTVFKRVGKDRLPIKAVQTIDVAQMFNTQRINAKVVQFIQTNLQRVFESEARYFTQRFGA